MFKVFTMLEILIYFELINYPLSDVGGNYSQKSFENETTCAVMHPIESWSNLQIVQFAQFVAQGGQEM